jgi:hypothetical protein
VKIHQSIFSFLLVVITLELAGANVDTAYTSPGGHPWLFQFQEIKLDTRMSQLSQVPTQ